MRTFVLPENRFIRWMSALPAKAWFAYAVVALIQLKVFWNVWLYRDLSDGDSKVYFGFSSLWYHNFTVDPIRSPLYTVFYGSLMALSPDAYVINILHRVIIAVVASLLVLAVARRLLPSPLALVIGVWWTILPINYDTMAELHLFSLIPLLVAYLIASARPTIVTRGAVLAALVIAAALVRTEYVAAAAAWGIFCLGYEIWALRRQGGRPLTEYLRGYGLPLLIAAAAIAFFFSRPYEGSPPIADGLAARHKLNFCQFYAVSYRQSHTDFDGNPWLDCSGLMLRDFGVSSPTMMEAVRSNPGAIIDFFRWNIGLIPDAVQVLLFNATAGDGQPDVAPVQMRRYPLFFGALSLLVLFVGGFCLWRDRRYWWETWIRPHWLGWLATFTAIPTAAAVTLALRPRPDYLFGLTVWLMLVLGLCFAALSRRLWIERPVNLVVPLAAAVILVVIPPHYTPQYAIAHTAGRTVERPKFKQYQRIFPYRDVLYPDPTYLATLGYGQILCDYISYETCWDFDIAEYMLAPAGKTFDEWLDEQQITVVYLEENALKQPAIQTFAADLDTSKWQVVARADDDKNHWLLLTRQPPSDAGDST